MLRALITCALMAAVVACTSSSKTTPGRDVTGLYLASGTHAISVSYTIAHLSDGRTRVRWTLDPATVSLAENATGNETASLVFRYALFYNYSTTTATDSGSLVLKEVETSGRPNFLGEFFVSVERDRNYLLEITLRDLNSMKVNKQYLDVCKPARFSGQSYTIHHAKDGEPASNFVTKADSFFVETFVPKPQLWLRFYSRDFPTASPPFAVVNPRPFDFTPDKMTRLKPMPDGRFKVIIAQTGFYQIMDDSAGQTGGTLHFFGNHFPEAKTVNDLLMPLRYITTSQEFQEMSQGENLKKYVDAFWLKIGGSPDRARMLIQSYYGRVEMANRLFSSYLEGWKSDRGMCYIVFGPPVRVLRSTSIETWFYGEAGKYNTLSLTFTKVINPFTDNDFRLNRNGSLKSPWYRAVDFWRQGRVITYQ